MVVKLNEDNGVKLSRLLAGLKAAGVEQGTRNKAVAEKTGYTEKTIGNILSGNANLSARFINTVCAAFDIGISWITIGGEPMLTPAGRMKHDPTFFWNPNEAEIGKIDREVFGIVSEERKDKERFIMGLVRRLPDPELKPVEDYLLDLVSKNK